MLPQDGDGDTDPAWVAIPIPATILDRLLIVQLDRSVASERIRRGREQLGEAERSTLSLGSADATAKSAERTYRASLRGDILAWDFRKQLLASFADPADYPPRSARRKTSKEAIKRPRTPRTSHDSTVSVLKAADGKNSATIKPPFVDGLRPLHPYVVSYTNAFEFLRVNGDDFFF